MARLCALCGSPFDCGIDGPDGCWCVALPPVAVPSGAIGGTCLCPRCLADAAERSGREAARGPA